MIESTRVNKANHSTFIYNFGKRWQFLWCICIHSWMLVQYWLSVCGLGSII